MANKVPDVTPGPAFLTRDRLRSILLSLLHSERDRLVQKGTLATNAALDVLLLKGPSDQIDAIAVDEDTFGFDSLAMLDVILAVNRFFQLHQTGVEDYLLIHRQIGDWCRLIEEHQRRMGPELSYGFQTSGSSGTPKTVVHRADFLMTEIGAQRAGPLAHLAPSGRVMSLVPPHHIFGFLFSCLLPLSRGSVVCDLHRAAPSAVFRTALPNDLVIGTPFNWETLGRTGLRFADHVHGVTSAGPSTPATWAAADRIGVHSLTEVFGSTETAGLGTRTRFGDPFELLAHLTPADGLVVSDRRAGPLALQDHLTWEGTRHFRVSGRKDDVVQIAGMNVSPSQVAASIKDVTGVVDVDVRPGDTRLKAFIVPSSKDTSQENLAEAVRSHLRCCHGSVAQLESITFGTRLPRNAMGKRCDWTAPQDL